MGDAEAADARCVDHPSTTVELQGNQIDFSMTRRSEISDVGKAKVEIPEGVQKLLDNKVKSEDKME